MRWKAGTGWSLEASGPPTLLHMVKFQTITRPCLTQRMRKCLSTDTNTCALTTKHVPYTCTLVPPHKIKAHYLKLFFLLLLKITKMLCVKSTHAFSVSHRQGTFLSSLENEIPWALSRLIIKPIESPRLPLTQAVCGFACFYDSLSWFVFLSSQGLMMTILSESCAVQYIRNEEWEPPPPVVETELEARLVFNILFHCLRL